MKMERTIINAAKQYLKDPIIEFRLLGGMSNLMFVVSDQGEKYTVRVVGRGAEYFVNRVEEQEHIKMFEKLNVTNKTLFFDLESGVKIAKFLPGEPLSNLVPTDHLNEVANVLKVVHQGPLSKYNYNYFKRLEKYELINDNLPKEYYQAKEIITNYYRDIYAKIPLRFTHGDSQPSNFVISDQVYLVDFEFSGNNDPFYDIACFGNKSFEDALELLPVYLGKTPSSSDLHRLYYHRATQTLQWFLVALYKDKIGLSNDLKIPFDLVSQNYLKKTFKLLGEMKNFE